MRLCPARAVERALKIQEVILRAIKGFVVTGWPAEHDAIAQMRAGNNLIMPGAVPFFAAADQILRADLAPMSALVLLIYYIKIFVLPMISMIAIRAWAGQRADAIFAGVNRFLERWERLIVIVLFPSLGAVPAIDGIGWFLEYPLIPVN